MAFSYIDPYSTTAYQNQVGNFNKYAGQFDTGYKTVSPYAEAAMKYFAPGGGYGQGQKIQATKKIQQGVARDTIAAVNAGMSSMSSARGLKTRAGSELATQYRNIEDQRATLGLQANSSYVNMINSLSWLATGYPKYNPTVLQEGGGGGMVRSNNDPNPFGFGEKKTLSPSGGGWPAGYLTGNSDGGYYQPTDNSPPDTRYWNWDENNPNYYGEDVSSGSNVDYWPDNTATQADDIPYVTDYNYDSGGYDSGGYDVNYYDPSASDYVDEGYYD